MKKFLPFIALFLIISGCSSVPQPSTAFFESSSAHIKVIETWSGYAKHKGGGECSDADVQLNVLEDYSITGVAQVIGYNMTIRLKGKLSFDGVFHASGTGGGFNVVYEGNFQRNSASGTWRTNWPGCKGTWELAKN
jgi:hypothetical protein